MDKYEEFVKSRQKMNERILEQGTLEIKRFFALDAKTYEAGALDEKTKELLGLAVSMVLRCDDCVVYHLIQAKDKGATDPEIFETFTVALVVGGSIVIPHLRRAVAFLDELKKNASSPTPE
jgi:AhpD family alkylhydroperoxidase